MNKCHKDECINRKGANFKAWREATSSSVSAKATNFNAWGNVCKKHSKVGAHFSRVFVHSTYVQTKRYTREKKMNEKKAANNIAQTKATHFNMCAKAINFNAWGVFAKHSKLEVHFVRLQNKAHQKHILFVCVTQQTRSTYFPSAKHSKLEVHFVHLQHTAN